MYFLKLDRRKDRSSRNWRSYYNGNTCVFINTKTGSKVRCTKEDRFDNTFPESIDLIISEKCTNNCPYCYTGCSLNGKEADPTDPQNVVGMMPFTEIALNINSEIPNGFEDYLDEYKMLDVIVNATIHMKDWMRHFPLLESLRDKDLLHGIGISFDKDAWKEILGSDDLKEHFMTENNVLHIVNGLVSADDLNSIDTLKPKVLVLGYKETHRGKSFKESEGDLIKVNMQALENRLPSMIEEYHVIAFDDLALDQLHVKDIIPEDVWDVSYIGKDGDFTMAVNLVQRTFALNSCEPAENWFPIGNKDVFDMFAALHN